ncbi:MAG: DUF6508 domain-containing protein [Ilumatobacteraceae bacterium]
MVVQRRVAAYSESALDLYHVLRATGLVVAFDWVTWLERSGYRRDRPPSSLSVADAVRHVTAVVRADRAAGTFAAALVDGSLLRSIDIILGAADTGRADALRHRRRRPGLSSPSGLAAGRPCVRCWVW